MMEAEWIHTISREKETESKNKDKKLYTFGKSWKYNT